MPNFDEIINSFAPRGQFAGPIETNAIDAEMKRKSILTALVIRKNECRLRFKVSISILILLLVILIYLSLYKPKDVQSFKDFMGILGGGSIIALLTYILSLRDELTKIRQTEIIATAVDSATLDTMLLTLSTK